MHIQYPAELYCERASAHNKTHRPPPPRLSHTHTEPQRARHQAIDRQQKNGLAKKEGYAFLLRGEAETRLCDYDKVRANTQAKPSQARRTTAQSSPALTHSPSPTIQLTTQPPPPPQQAMRTFQLGCKADARLGPRRERS